MCDQSSTRRHAAVDRAERAEEVAGIDVVGGVFGAEGALHDVAIILERAVGEHVAQDALPHVPMGIDEAGHHDHPRGVDDLGVRRGDVRPHGGDGLAFDEDVGGFEIAERAVEACSTWPFLMRSARPGAGAAGGCWAAAGPMTDPAALAASSPRCPCRENCAATAACSCRHHTYRNYPVALRSSVMRSSRRYWRDAIALALRQPGISRQAIVATANVVRLAARQSAAHGAGKTHSLMPGANGLRGTKRSASAFRLPKRQRDIASPGGLAGRSHFRRERY